MKTRRCLATACLVALAAVGSAQKIQVIVNGSPVAFESQGPVMSGERVLVPLRGVLEKLGAEVNWDPGTQTVSARRGADVVRLGIGQRTAAVNGKPVDLDVPAQIMNGSTMVPLRFVGEALGQSVHWDASTYTVEIKDGGDYRMPPPRELPPPPESVPAPTAPNMLEANDVIPVLLNVALDSNRCRPGQAFDTLVTRYPGLPDGCHIRGTVADVVPRSGNDPGMIELNFTDLVFPNGQRRSITGHAIRLDNPDIVRQSTGRLQYGQRGVDSPKRGVFAGFANGQRIVTLNTSDPIHSSFTSRAVREKVATSTPQAANRPTDVHLARGTKFGVRLTDPIRIR